MAHARIYQQAKNAMQSGRARTDQWVMEYEPAEPKRPDPLTGWAGSGDTRGQVSLTFPTLAAAQAYAGREGLTAHVVAGPEKKLKIQAYADNFQVGPISF
ncbi:ETC complex I subunit [Rhizorhabdus dicambivorans]|uniref:Oxidoreductase n=1 Tax=Rhizorhabdus dicambivorans TaxID=1850238 RepID=A0A2A4G1X7_9SPHN|nr:ETC complex I subunit [Rhizorhabdus dicambivorans]ATE67512.1 oxidoreductase [Rhizorhabdus dicambivorans]PCE44029.1 oxidoreductase [Rhizorhabdus dicambivorans]